MGQKNMVFNINLNNVSANPQWYVVVTKYNYEQKVGNDILLGIKNQELEDDIVDVVVPVKETVTKSITKTGKETERVRVEKIYPLYVFVKAKMNIKVWDFLRNLSGAATILASGGEPVTMSDADVVKIKSICGIEKDKVKKEFKGSIGDKVNIISGPCEGLEGFIVKLNLGKSKASVQINNFPVEVYINDLEVID